MCPGSLAAVCDAEVVRQDNGSISSALNIPLYTWWVPAKPPRAVIITIHGVTLHGGVFDRLAHYLAQEGYLVVSPDLRGFGRWCLGNNQYLADGEVSFHKSRVDLIHLLAYLKSQYPRIPVYCVGESLGANLALWLASICPNYLDGIVLSSTCVKRKLDLCSPLLVDTFRAVADHNRQLSTVPYVRRYLSEDPRITETYLEDPLVRHTMSLYESFQSLHTARSTIWFVEQIPANMPILVIEGTKDKMFEPREILRLLSKIKSRDQQMCWLTGKGHIHLETPHVSEQVLKTISDWLDVHVAQAYRNDQANTLVSTNESTVPQRN
jgi:alpha-beta hydrolase superfamily lysophospholipase